MEKYLTAKELRDALAKVSDDAEIVLRVDEVGIAKRVIIGYELFVIITDC